MATHATEGTFQASIVNVTVLPAFTSQYDPRSLAKKLLDTIEANLPNGTVQSYSIAVGGSSRTITYRTMSEWMKARQDLNAEIVREQQAAEFARTGINTSRIGVRFARI